MKNIYWAMLGLRLHKMELE